MSTLRERGFKGLIYHTPGVANVDFLRVAGRHGEGMVVPTGPVLVGDVLPDSHPSKKPALTFLSAYEGKYGESSRNNFAGYAYDAYLLLDKVVAEAAKKGKPGTDAFRQAIRAGLEAVKEMPVTHGVVNMTETDHSGMDHRSIVLITSKDGKWAVLE